MSIEVDINDLNNDAYLRGIDAGKEIISERITNWVNENRQFFEIEAGIGFYRDSFSSEDLLRFLDETT